MPLYVASIVWSCDIVLLCIIVLSFQHRRQIVDPVTGGAKQIPIVWPPSEETMWLHKQVELYARKVETPADVEAWHAKSKVDLHELIEKQCIPQGFVKLMYDPSIEHRFSHNWDYSEVKERGFVWGNRFGDVAQAREPFFAWDVLIGLIANVVQSSRTIVFGTQK